MAFNGRGGKYFVSGLLLLLALSAPAFAQVHGAIFTTDVSGNTNVNLYAEKKDVWVNGGPRKAGAAGLPEGFYYIKVTDPSGATLLGTSTLNPLAPGALPQNNNSKTPIHVGANGEFDAPVQLWFVVRYLQGNGSTQGYKDTPNNGNEYKVWVSQDPLFTHSQTKTDNFKVRKGPVIPPQVAIEAYKFRDTNGNGTWNDPPEQPIAGWTIELRLASTNALLGTSLTDGGGKVSFLVNQSTTNYIVKEVMQSPFVNTTPLSFTVSASQNQAVEFGNWIPMQITAYKFRDTNGNGAWDATESPIAGWEIHLSPGIAGANTAFTDATGKAVFTVDRNGSQHVVSEIIPPGFGWAATTPASVPVVAGLPAPSVVFGNWIPCTISVFKFYDRNQNGVWDQPAEPAIPNWKIELHNGLTNALIDTKFTNSTGQVVWIVDMNGTQYSVVEIMPLPTAPTYSQPNPPQWVNTTPLSVAVTADAATKEVRFGNVAVTFEPHFGLGRTKGFWHNQNGAAMLAACQDQWWTGLNALGLVWPNGDAFTITANNTNDAHTQLAAWIVAVGAIGNPRYILGTQLAALWLNVHCGPMSELDNVYLIYGYYNGNVEGEFEEASDMIADPEANPDDMLDLAGIFDDVNSNVEPVYERVSSDVPPDFNY